MAVPLPLASRRTVTALLTLTAVTGLVDAVSYLRLGRVFVANMTGNVVFLGFSAAPHSGVSAVASLIAITGFLLGALAGGRAAHTLAATGPVRWLATAFTGEAVVLGLVAVLTATSVLPFTGDGRFATIAVLAAALGVQNSTVRHLRAPDLTTTVLTLTLTGLTADSALTGGPGAKPHRRLGSVAVMLAGAAAGAAILQWSPAVVIAIAAALVAAVAVAFMTAVPDRGRRLHPDPSPFDGRGISEPLPQVPKPRRPQ
ncbi:YoaK family protein [Streptomyces sp. NPDC048415]|uniref:YoaK family protein n=1 Tax=Streptomyces sp. NPDC048415 TaxID=3154822 RepID=UPI0034412AA0